MAFDTYEYGDRSYQEVIKHQIQEKQQTCKTCKWFLDNECMDCRNYVNYKFRIVNEDDTCEYYTKG